MIFGNDGNEKKYALFLDRLFSLLSYANISLDNIEKLKLSFSTNDSFDCYQQIAAYYISLSLHFVDNL